ncbi:hypothetical protein VTJ83DRAFT_179 [Remersonia thermophila]|uniref:Uncharacterized protein n=1 Tax=Remersonia thermophila TaxID=72144 RepID=A0ABR4DK95_9PEZI
MSLFSAQLHPGRALGFLVLGASLHDVLTRLKAEPQRFPKIHLAYHPQDPVRTQIHVGLPANGLRLRFDGPEQRLRLIEVVDFGRIHIFLKPANDKERDLVRPQAAAAAAAAAGDGAAGPTFRHIYQRFLGPTYDGEYVAADQTYLLSYPGVAFSFPLPRDAYDAAKDVVSLLPAAAVPGSMAVFSGASWAAARAALWSEVLPSVRLFPPLAKGRDASPDEVSLVRVHGAGRLQLVRRWSGASSWIALGETTPQQLVAELGPPDAIYRKSDQRMYIHKSRRDDPTDTDQSSSHPASDADDARDEAVEDGGGDGDGDADADADGPGAGGATRECFYNYFYLGFDVLVSPPTEPHNPPAPCRPEAAPPASPDRDVATKLIVHGNVPGSYPFNRYRRCRWEIAYLPDGAATSETPFPEVEERLRAAWAPAYASADEARQSQRGMVLNRGWGDSPGSSCELLGGWEGDADADARPADHGNNLRGRGEDTTTTLYGFPGLVFEVLKTGWVSAVTVF